METPKVYLTRRNNGIYYYGIKNALNNIQWLSTKCSDKVKARQFVKTLKQDTPESTFKIPSLSEFLETYKAQKSADIRPRTLAINSYAISFIISMIGNKNLDAYTTKDIEHYKLSLIKKGFSPVTVNMSLRASKAVFSHAVKQDIILKNPFCKVSQLKTVNKKIQYISKDELETICSHANSSTLRDLFTVTYLTGMRLGEVVNLRWVNVDLVKRQLLVLSNEDYQTKTGKSRVIPMHEAVYNILKDKKQKVYVFDKPGGYKFTESYITHHFKKCATDAKVNTDYTFHSLRHSAASALVNSGVSIFEVQKILGHSSPVLTANTYSHLLPTTLLNSINRIQF